MIDRKAPVLIFEYIKDRIIIEDKDSYDVYLTLGLDELTDFYLEIEFQSIDAVDYKKLMEYWNQLNRLKFSSTLIKREDIKITHIVVTEISTDNRGKFIWKCLSDDPLLYEGLESK